MGDGHKNKTIETQGSDLWRRNVNQSVKLVLHEMGKRTDYRSVIGGQFIHKIQVKNLLLFAGVVVPRGATQKTFKTLNNQANEYKYWQSPVIKVLVSYNKNVIVIYYTVHFLIMLNDNYTQRHILLLQTI